MPEVMLPHTWPNRFRRTVNPKNGKPRVMVFSPGVPVELKPSEIDLLKADIGTALHPIFRDARGKPRVLRDSEQSLPREEADHVSAPAG